MRGVQQLGAESGIFVWRGQVARLIYLSRQPPPPPPLTHTHFFIIYTIFYFIIYIYKHTQQQKKNFAFSIKIIFDVDLS